MSVSWNREPVKVSVIAADATFPWVERRRMGKRVQVEQVQFKLMLATDGTKYTTYMVPLKPWPQSFYVSTLLLNNKFDGLLEARPLTLTGLVKGVLKNFIVMNWWRINYSLWKCGFYDLNEGETFSWGKLRLKFWETFALRKARQVADRMNVDWRGLL